MDRLPVDYEDADTGFMVGRQAALADWRFRKEQREGALLIQRLVVARSQRRWRAAHPVMAAGLRRTHRLNRLAKEPDFEARYYAEVRAKKEADAEKARIRARARYERIKADPVEREKRREYIREWNRRKYRENPKAAIARSSAYKTRRYREDPVYRAKHNEKHRARRAALKTARAA